MEVQKKREGSTLTICLSGRINTADARELKDEVEAALEGIRTLVFDLEGLTYIVSAGLRVFLIAQNILDDREGHMKLIHVSPFVRNVLEMTRIGDGMNIS